jgi:hypothetical protein
VTFVVEEQGLTILKARRNIDLANRVYVLSDGGGMSSHDLEVRASSNWQEGKASLREHVVIFVRGRMSDLLPDL